MIKEMKVIGIDPALVNLGLAQATLSLETLEYTIQGLLLVETSNETTKQIRKNSDDVRRAGQLYAGLIKAITEHGATLAFIEIPVGSQSARAMASYGMCCMLIAACPIPVIQVSPDEVKMAAVGNKQAAKEEMIQWATAKFPGANWLTDTYKGELRMLAKNEHLADAIAAIAAGVQTNQFQQLLAMYRVRSA